MHMVTGQWGETITNTTEESLYDETFTYTIPADYNNIPVVLQDLEIVVFVTETEQYIVSGNGTYPTFTNLPLDNDTNIVGLEEINDQCGLDFGPRVIIQNNGNNLLTSIDFEYSINIIEYSSRKNERKKRSISLFLFAIAKKGDRFSSIW